MPENTTQPFRGFFSAMEAMKKIDAICGEDWGGDEEIFRTNSDLQDLYATYKDEMGPLLVKGAGITGDHAIWFGDFVRRMGNLVLHETCNSKSIHARKALDVIGKTKEFIEHMY